MKWHIPVHEQIVVGYPDALFPSSDACVKKRCIVFKVGTFHHG